MELCDPGTVRALLARHGFHFSKSMGQNFLIDPQVPRDIAAASQADEHCGVLEIGPGIGSLTVQLAQRAGKVVCVELSGSLLPVLQETLAEYPNVEVIPADALKIDLQALAAEKLAGFTPIVCANLPYNITTPLLTRLVEASCFQTLTVLIQKEVAQRLCAPQGSTEGSAFSLFLQYYMETVRLFDVLPSAFVPAPKVTSSVMRCVRRPEPAVAVEDEAFFFQVIRGAFLLRRKTLLNSLSAAFGAQQKTAVAAAIAQCGLPPAVRGESLTLEQFAALSAALEREMS